MRLRSSANLPRMSTLNIRFEVLWCCNTTSTSIVLLPLVEYFEVARRPWETPKLAIATLFEINVPVGCLSLLPLTSI